MKITFFGSSITSSYWNGAATYYRGICAALHALGHRPVFVEQDIYDRQRHRDLAEDPEYAQVVICRDLPELDRELEMAMGSDLVVKCSGAGRYDDYLEREILRARTPHNRVIFWDVDAPFTLDRAFREPDWDFRELVPRYDAVLAYGGGPAVERGYRALGARRVELVYNALDPSSHYPVPPDPAFRCDLLFVGNRLPDRESRVRAFFLEAAQACPNHRFLLGGEGWGDLSFPPNVRYLGHVETALHNRLNSSARLVLNRVFEAAGAGACVVTDQWEGIEQFLTPGLEVLVASGTEDVVAFLHDLSPIEAAAIGRRALARTLGQHTYQHRGRQLAVFLEELFQT